MPEITRLTGEPAEEGAAARVVTWVDLDTSDLEDRAWLAAESGLSERAQRRLLNPARVNRREFLEDGLFVNLEGLGAGRDSDPESLVSLRLLMGAERVITAHAEKVVAIEDLRSHLAAGRGPSAALEFLAFIASGVVERLEGVILDIVKDTDEIEDRLLEETRPYPFEDLNGLRRSVLQMRRQLVALRTVLTLVASDPTLTIDKAEKEALVQAAEHVTRHIESLEDCRERAQLLHDQIESRLSAAMARSNYNLTVVATVFLPLTFATGLLGMNVAGIPEAHDPWSFWGACFFLTLIGAIAWILLRRREWN